MGFSLPLQTKTTLTMITLKELYRIGYGPSSSHTMAPRKAATLFLERNPKAVRFEVTLYGSLAATGKGHMTDKAILDVLDEPRTTIIWKPKTFLPYHPNGMKFQGFDAEGHITENWTVFSIGGGALGEEGKQNLTFEEIYPMNSATEILAWCMHTGKSYWEYVEECEGKDIWDYLEEVWNTMQQAVRNGLEHEGVLPGPLGLRRKATSYYVRADGYQHSMRTRGLLLRIRPCRQRRECRRRKNRHGPHLRLLRRTAVCVIPSLRIAAYQRPTYPQSFGHSRPFRKHREEKCIHIRC